MIYITDKNNTAPLIYYSSIKSRRIVRSVLGAEKFGMADACDSSIILKHEIKKIKGESIKINIITDSETLFDDIILNTSTIERRLMIDIKAAREAYNEVIINDLIWIRMDYNLADTMKKSKVLPQLVAVMKTGKTKYEV